MNKLLIKLKIYHKIINFKMNCLKRKLIRNMKFSFPQLLKMIFYQEIKQKVLKNK